MAVSQKPRKKHKPSLYQLVIANRKTLRRFGLTRCALVHLEALAKEAPKGMIRQTVAALGRILGNHRNTSLRYVRQLEDCGLVIRLRSGMMIDAAKLRSIVKIGLEEKATYAKSMYLKAQSKLAPTLIAHRDLRNNLSSQEPETGAQAPDWRCLVPDMATARAELAATYIPVHLRKSYQAT